jgi:hypothetical protein
VSVRILHRPGVGERADDAEGIAGRAALCGSAGILDEEPA